MSDTTKRDAVLAEFMGCGGHICEGCEVQCTNVDGRTPIAEDMADEIVRQRQRAERAESILAALLEPSEAVIKASAAAYAKCEAENESFFTHHIGIAFALLAAIAAAEREVDA